MLAVERLERRENAATHGVLSASERSQIASHAEGNQRTDGARSKCLVLLAIGLDVETAPNQRQYGLAREQPRKRTRDRKHDIRTDARGEPECALAEHVLVVSPLPV